MNKNSRNSINANEQSFQSIYLEPSPKTWQERIVFHDPVFQDEIPGVVALKSLELENLIGLVIAAPLNVLRHFRELVYETDRAEGWGQEDAATIIAKIVKTAKGLGAVIVYEQLGGEVPNVRPEDIPDGDEAGEGGEAAYFFDPLTKRKIVEKGPHYFDPTLVTLEDVTKKTSDRYEKSEAVTNPGIASYPKNITDVGRKVWDDIISGKEVDIFKYQSRKKRWEYAKYIYETECSRIGVPDYRPFTATNPAVIFKKLKSSQQQIKHLLETVLLGLEQRGLSRQAPTRDLAFDVRRMDDNNFYLTTCKSLPLEGTADAGLVLKYLTDEHNFYKAKTQTNNGYKPVNETTKLTFSEDRNKPNHLKIYTIYLLTDKEAEIISKTKDSDKIKYGLMKLLNTWVKTGRLK